MRGEAALSTSSIQLVDMHAERRHRSRRNLITCSRHCLQMFSTEPRGGEKVSEFNVVKKEVMMCKACSRVLNDVLRFLKFHQRFTVNGRCGEWPLKWPRTVVPGSMLTSQILDGVKGLVILYAHCCPFIMLSELSSRLSMKKTPSVSESTFISFVC